MYATSNVPTTMAERNYRKTSTRAYSPPHPFCYYRATEFPSIYVVAEGGFSNNNTAARHGCFVSKRCSHTFD